MEDPRDLSAWADLLRHNWQARADSEYRNFYVASLPDWRDERSWQENAAIGADVLTSGFSAERLAQADVLEIGCGIGRLARPIAQRVRSYTGIDIAEGMVREARSSCADLPNARFFVNDGLSLPAETCDRTYDLVFAFAVFIHCPREVIRSLVEAGFERLAPGGQLRFQLRADALDPTGIEAPPEVAERTHRDIERIEASSHEGPKDLIENHYYMGDAFRYDEVRPLLAGWTGGRVQLFRYDLANLYGWVEKEGPSA